MTFDPETLTLFDRTKEVDIETTRPDDRTRRTTIWIVVADGDVLARSWHGDRAHWYQTALDRSDETALLVDGSRVPVRVERAIDDDSVARCSAALQAKYAGDPSTAAMVSPEILHATVRLVPR